MCVRILQACAKGEYVCLFVCLEMFVVGHSIVGLVLGVCIYAINIVFEGVISEPTGNKNIVMTNLKCWCDLLSIQEAIDVMHLLVHL
jgi:hypothetical protein